MLNMNLCTAKSMQVCRFLLENSRNMVSATIEISSNRHVKLAA